SGTASCFSRILTGENSRILMNDRYRNAVTALMRYATTIGTLANATSRFTVPLAHSAAVLAAKASYLPASPSITCTGTGQSFTASRTMAATVGMVGNATTSPG